MRAQRQRAATNAQRPTRSDQRASGQLSWVLEGKRSVATCRMRACSGVDARVGEQSDHADETAADRCKVSLGERQRNASPGCCTRQATEPRWVKNGENLRNQVTDRTKRPAYVVPKGKHSAVTC